MINLLNISSVTILSLTLLSFFSSCAIDNEGSDFIQEAEETAAYPLADPALWPYYESFEKEAQSRGLSYDLNALEITGVVEEISEDGVAGTCRYGSHINHVTIDQSFWNSFSELRRELVVYHELGHCVLFKDHTEDDNGEGICLSLMNSGTTTCRVAYNLQNRAYYIDELFSNLE